MPAPKHTATPATPEPAAEPMAEQIPQSGGSYLRQPDGTLAQNTPTPAPAATKPADQE